MSTNSVLKEIFNNSRDLFEFYRQLPEEYKNIKSNAYEIITYFGSTYNCEQFFSLMCGRKTSSTNRLAQKTLESCLRIKSSSDIADIESIIKSRKYNKSH